MIPFKTIQDLSAEVAESYCPSGNADTKWHTSGIINFNAPFNRFTLGPDLPLITEGADEQVGRGRSQHIDRNAAAVLLDWNLRRLSQGKAVIDLRLGELLVEFRKRHPEKLGFIRLADYTREEMGIPWRSASLLVNNWTALEKLPGLMRAHREGRISKSKLRFLLRVATAENEEAWIEKASKVSVRALEDLVKAEEARRKGGGTAAGASAMADTDAGNSDSDTESVPDGRASETDEKSVPDGRASETDEKPVPASCNLSSCREGDRAGYLMSLITTPEKAAIWDSALEHFRGHEGGNFSTEVFIEALLAEFCSALPLPEDSARSSAAGGQSNTSVLESNTSASSDAPLPQSRHWRRITGDEDDEFVSTDGKEADEERERWRELRKDLEDVTKIWKYLSWTPVTVETPLEWDDALVDIRAVADMIKKIVAMRQLVGFYMGRLLRTFENLHLYADMQFASLNHYAVERLGISMRTARNLIKLARSFLSLPVLEKAFKDGVLTQQRALLLLKVATEKTEKEWLRYGVEVPALDLELEVKRLSRLIEAKPNLLEAYRVLPGFSPPEKTRTETVSGIEAQKAEVGPPGAVEKISSVPVQMCATEASSGNIAKESSDFPAHSSAPDPSCNPACSTGRNTAAISFFIPDSLIPMWNYAFIRYLEFAAGSGTAHQSPSLKATGQVAIPSDHTGTEIQPVPSAQNAGNDSSGPVMEGFLFSLIYHYLENEYKILKKKKRRLRHKIIERDGFRCVIPGCSSRSALDDHHITFRSQGGGDELPNNASTCFEHHRHCIHDKRYITIKGQAPDNLTVAMGVEPGRPPFALFINGRRTDTNACESV